MRKHREEASAIAVIVAMCAGLMAGPAAAVDDLVLNVAPGSETVMPGDTLIITMDVANLTAAINGVQALMQYDVTILSLVDIAPTNLGLIPPAEGWVEVAFSDNSGDITYAAVINGSSTIVDGTVATLTFSVIGEGFTNVSFRADVPPFFTKFTVAADNTTILPVKVRTGAITSACDDGLYCNGLETLLGGSCQVGTPPDCTVLTDQCSDGVCNETSDACEAVPTNEGLPCDDSDLCTENDTCISGVCSTTPVDCSPFDDACNVGMCDLLTGLCFADPANEGGSCDDGVFCNGTDTCNVGVCISAGDPCVPLFCDEAGDVCLAPVHVNNLEVFYSGRFGSCVGGNRDGLDCSSDNDCIGTLPTPDGVCSGPWQGDPSVQLLAAGSIATVDNISNYVRGITGIRVYFNQIVEFATTPEAAFTFEWSDPPECVGGTNDGSSCNPDPPNPSTDPCIEGGGSCQVLFFPVTNASTAITVSPAVQGGATVAEIVLADNHVRRRWLKVTIDSTQVTTTGVELDGELVGNPVVLPSGDAVPGGDAIFYLGNQAGDVDGDRKTVLADIGVIRLEVHPFRFLPITNAYDVDKDVKVLLTDVAEARFDVNPFFRLPLIAP